MEWVEIILLIIGIGAFAASFFVRTSGEQLSREERKRTDEEIKARIDKQMEEAAAKINQSVDDAVQYAVDKTERSLERVSNEKIMGVSEYADTVLTDIHKNHEEVVFLYDMLNDKQTALKNSAAEVEKTAKAASVLAKEAKESAEAAAENAAQAAASADEAAENAAQAADSADEASQIAQDATQNIDEAIDGAKEALKCAQDAAGRADAARRTADDAAVRADSARQTAGAALQAANEAILSADTARQTAGDAMKNAKEVQKLSGAKSTSGTRQRAAGAESQNLSGLARMQEIREAQSEAEERLKEKEHKEQIIPVQEPEKALEPGVQKAEGAPQTGVQRSRSTLQPAATGMENLLQTEIAGMESMPQAGTQRKRSTPQPPETGLERMPQGEELRPAQPQVQPPKPEQGEPGISVMDIRQRTAANDTDGFRPFVIPRVKVLGEPVEEEAEKDIQRPARTRSTSAGRRSAKKPLAANETREVSAPQSENNTEKHGGAGTERNNNEKILAMHQEGKSNIAIARELGIGVGEVKLVIDLFKM